MRLRRSRPDVSALAGVALFDGYGRRRLAALALHVDRVTIAPGASLARAGRRAHEVVVVLSGEAIVRRAGVEVARVGPGAAVGAVETPTAAAHEHDVVAVTPVSALVIEGRAFRSAVQTLPGLTERLAAYGQSAPPRRSGAPAAPLGSAA